MWMSMEPDSPGARICSQYLLPDAFTSIKPFACAGIIFKKQHLSSRIGKRPETSILWRRCCGCTWRMQAEIDIKGIVGIVAQIRQPEPGCTGCIAGLNDQFEIGLDGIKNGVHGSAGRNAGITKSVIAQINDPLGWFAFADESPTQL